MAWFDRGGTAPLIIKSDLWSAVHRRAPLEMIVLPVRKNGLFVGLSIVLGLWTSAALRAEPEQVPVLRERLRALEAKHHFAPNGHNGKALRHTLSELPRDILISVDEHNVELLALTAMSLADRPRPKLVLLPDTIQSHLFAFAWLPREAATTPRRDAIRALLERETGGIVRFAELEQGKGQLSLPRYTLDLPLGATMPEPLYLDATLEAILRGWDAAMEAELTEAVGMAKSTRLMLEWAATFPASYRDRVLPAEAALDIIRLAILGEGNGLDARFHRRTASGEGSELLLKLYQRGDLLPLSQTVPVLENFGFAVLDHHRTSLEGTDAVAIHEFVLDAGSSAYEASLYERALDLEVAIVATLESRIENDAFNALMGFAGLDRQGVTLFRAWFRYLRQAGVSLGQQTVAEVFQRWPAIAQSLITLFRARHHPRTVSTSVAQETERQLENRLADVSAIEDDRIIRMFSTLIVATLRTNAFTEFGNSTLAFKLDSTAMPWLPKPRPWREIWVYSPRLEGIHLRGGEIARGGLRWSDRRDDFRTEILGLMKAQVVKNAVIVPTGAKGGFFPKKLPPISHRDAYLTEGTECYRTFIRALLSVTDNLDEGQIIPPTDVVRLDGDDPYLVVAADKGTAAFSDLANEIALDRGFWLGDAFASGGSVGYDHKAMGITARGAWISVQGHFAEQGIDVQSESVRVIGCGDMSGDVFGNGMLMSKQLQLVAAFDHRHIFLDPHPDPATSYAERARLFSLHRSSWDDYDRSLLSSGGGIFSRSQKAIPLTTEVRQLLGVSREWLDPYSLIAAILKCSADLLWFGGIGTYVKAASESHSQVGDPSNDLLRIDAEALRVKVIGEGANLGITQAGRIAFAQGGGRLNTDFIDNSAGVDCSDKEVNIKVALSGALRRDELSAADRDALLVTMTDEVSALVLADNHAQNLALSLFGRNGAAALPSQLRLIEALEMSGRIDRSVDAVASNDEFERRMGRGEGLTRPELAVLLSHAKLAIQNELEGCGAISALSHGGLLRDAFPRTMQMRFADDIKNHQLARQIIATRLANDVVNRLGPSTPFDIASIAKVTLADVAIAFSFVSESFLLDEVWTLIDRSMTDYDEKIESLARLVRFAKRQTLDALKSMPAGAEITELVGLLSPEMLGLLQTSLGSDNDPTREIVGRIDQLENLDGIIGLATVARKLGVNEAAATAAFARMRDFKVLDDLEAL